MALFGLRLSEKLNAPTEQQIIKRKTYGDIIRILSGKTSEPGWRIVQHDKKSGVGTIRLYPPFNGWTPRILSGAQDWTISTWVRWLENRAQKFCEYLLSQHTLQGYAWRIVNGIVLADMLGSFLNGESCLDLMPLLLLDNEDSPLLGRLKGRTFPWSTTMEGTADYVLTVAGVKYIRALPAIGDSMGYEWTCTFGKHIPAYAKVAYYDTEFSRNSAIRDHSTSVSLLEHYDTPSMAPHIVIPSRVSLATGFGSLISVDELLLLESAIDGAMQNANAGRFQAVLRRDETYWVVNSKISTRDLSLQSRLRQLGWMIANGFSFERQWPTQATETMVKELIGDLMGPGEPFNAMTAGISYIPLFRDSPSVMDTVNERRYKRTQVRSGRPSGSTPAQKDSDVPLRWQPQWSDISTQTLDDDDDYQHALVKGKVYKLGVGFSGGAFIRTWSSSSGGMVIRDDDMPELPLEYFGVQQQHRRSIFSQLRKTGDKSLLKDAAVLQFVSTVMDPHAGEPVLKDDFSMLYLGASNIHTSSNEPLILDRLRKGTVPGVPGTTHITQMGYEVVHGPVIDARKPIPTGTYTLVYSDVDQIVNGGEDMVAATETAKRVTLVALSCTTLGGITVVKINFPNRRWWTVFFNTFRQSARDYALVKPMIVNNVEVYLVMMHRTMSGNLTPTANLRLFLGQLMTRYREIDTVMQAIPTPNQSDSDTALIGMSTIQLFGTEAVVKTCNRGNRAITVLANRTGGTQLTFGIENFGGSNSLTLCGRRSLLSDRRLRRLKELPMTDLSSLSFQHRTAPFVTPSFFFDRPADGFSVLAAGYNAIQRSMDWTGLKVLDLGTGPECRCLSLFPADTPVEMIDIRPAVERMDIWETDTTYHEADFLLPTIWNMTTATACTAIFSLGNAAGFRNTPLLTVLQNVMDECKRKGIEKMLFQLNCPLTSKRLGRDWLQINTKKKTFTFPTLSRVEPYSTADEVEKAIRNTFPNAAYSWITLSDTLGWIATATLGGMQLDMSILDDVLLLSEYLPLMLIDTRTTGITATGQLVVNQQTQLTIPVPGRDASIRMLLQDVLVAEGGGLKLWSQDGTLTQQYQDSPSAYIWTWTPSTVGVHSINVGDIGHGQVLCGTVNVGAPDAHTVVTYGDTIDYTEAGNVATIAVDLYYRVDVFYHDGEEYKLVNPSRACVKYNNGAPELNFIADFSNTAVVMLLCDVTDGVIGQEVFVRLNKLHTLQFPTTEPLIISDVLPNESWIVRESGTPICTLPLSAGLPQDWSECDLNYAVHAYGHSYIVPPGSYELVRVVS
uniref:Guanylyl transferase/methyl transferase n=1 Tax=Grass carp reovirus TaxID=128987 RepID=S5LVP7_GCRV|nr:guanylyl transferase/methyl transferase [Grass carp reovirus]